MKHTLHKKTGFQKLARECKITLSGALDWGGGQNKRRKKSHEKVDKSIKNMKAVEEASERKEETDYLSTTNISISDSAWIENE